MHLHAELSVDDIFDVEHVEVHDGVATKGRRPRHVLFIWRDPAQRHDLLVFVSEAQPAHGRYTLSHRLLDLVVGLGVERVFTFAAMATQLHPTQTPRVFAAATEATSLRELEEHNIELLKEGQISGLNGVFLAAAAERGLSGACLLGEMPFFAGQLPNPAASRAVLQVMSQLAGFSLDMKELDEHATTMEKHLLELLERLQSALQEQGEGEESFSVPSFAESEPEPKAAPSKNEPGLTLEQRDHIEALFEKARQDRAKAFELKTELDRLRVFKFYEDRFLDLFKTAE